MLYIQNSIVTIQRLGVKLLSA